MLPAVETALFGVQIFNDGLDDQIAISDILFPWSSVAINRGWTPFSRWSSCHVRPSYPATSPTPSGSCRSNPVAFNGDGRDTACAQTCHAQTHRSATHNTYFFNFHPAFLQLTGLLNTLSFRHPKQAGININDNNEILRRSGQIFRTIQANHPAHQTASTVLKRWRTLAGEGFHPSF